jgi:hypothetical protein
MIQIRAVTVVEIQARESKREFELIPISLYIYLSRLKYSLISGPPRRI